MQKNQPFIIDQDKSISEEQQKTKLGLLESKKQEQEVVLSDSQDEDSSEEEMSSENEQQDKDENNIQKIAEELVNKQPQKEDVQIKYGDKNTEFDTKFVLKDGKMVRVTKKRTTQKLSLIKNITEVEDVTVKKLPQNEVKDIQQDDKNVILQKKQIQVNKEQEHILSDEAGSESEGEDFEQVEDSPTTEEKENVDTKIETSNRNIQRQEKVNNELEFKTNSSKNNQQFQFEDNGSDDESEEESEEDTDQEENQQKYKRISKRVPKKDEFQIESQDEGLIDTESEAESQEVKIATDPQVKLKVNRNKNNSMVFEEEYSDQSMVSEESRVEEFENQKMNYNRKKSLLKQEHHIPQYSKLDFYCSIGTCCFVFCLSSILWIILLRILVIKNQKIREIVYDIPTLGNYHDIYTDFFNQYDNNRDKLFETQEILQFKNNPEFKQFQDSVGSFVSSQDQLNNDLYESKVLLSSMQNKENEKQLRRRLTKSSQQKYTNKNYNNEQKIDLIIRKLEESQENLKNMENQLNIINNINNDKFNTVYDSAIDNLSKLYEDSFSLIDLYGRFYVMTNRIWVTTQNIYNLFDKRVIQIDKEMKKDHFKEYTSIGENIHLPELNFKIADIVPKVEEINLNIDEPSLVQCKLEYEINNHDLTLIDNSFDLFIVLDGLLTKESEEKNSFNLKVNSKKDTDSFQNFFQLGQGNHNISVWAKVYKEGIKFKYIDLKCLVFLEYPDIEEYNKTD